MISRPRPQGSGSFNNHLQPTSINPLHVPLPPDCIPSNVQSIGSFLAEQRDSIHPNSHRDRKIRWAKISCSLMRSLAKGSFAEMFTEFNGKFAEICKYSFYCVREECGNSVESLRKFCGKFAEILRKVCGNFTERLKVSDKFLQRPLPERPQKWMKEKTRSCKTKFTNLFFEVSSRMLL